MSMNTSHSTPAQALAAQLKAWSNSPLRDALFVNKHTDGKAFFQDKVIMRCGGFQVTYTGPQLDKDDLLLWDAMIKMARQPAGSYTCTAAYMLGAIGQKYSPPLIAEMHARLRRLKATAVEISTEKGGSAMYSLVRSLSLTGEKYLITLDPQMAECLKAVDPGTR